MKTLDKLTPIEIEIVRRTAHVDDGVNIQSTLDWIAGGITPVKTATAFQLAKGGREVFQIYADGTDTLLDDIEAESEYYPDKSKSYPEIETIFVVEGDL